VPHHFYLPKTDSRRTFPATWRVVVSHPWRAAAVTVVLCALAAGGMMWMKDGLWFSGSGKTTPTAHVGSSSVSTSSAGQSDTPSAPIQAVQQDDSRAVRPIRLQVLNGCAMKDMAKILAPQLRAMGFDVREVRRADSSRYTHTIIKDRVNRIELAQIAADSVGVDRALITTEPAENLADIDVTIIIGADYRQLRFHKVSQKE
jgi:hypothetical protein